MADERNVPARPVLHPAAVVARADQVAARLHELTLTAHEHQASGQPCTSQLGTVTVCAGREVLHHLQAHTSRDELVMMLFMAIGQRAANLP